MAIVIYAALVMWAILGFIVFVQVPDSKTWLGNILQVVVAGPAVWVAVPLGGLMIWVSKL